MRLSLSYRVTLTSSEVCVCVCVCVLSQHHLPMLLHTLEARRPVRRTQFIISYGVIRRIISTRFVHYQGPVVDGCQARKHRSSASLKCDVATDSVHAARSPSLSGCYWIPRLAQGSRSRTFRLKGVSPKIRQKSNTDSVRDRQKRRINPFCMLLDVRRSLLGTGDWGWGGGLTVLLLC